MSDFMVRPWGCVAPDGSPEREYYLASLRMVDFSGPKGKTAEFIAAEKRLAREGCPPFASHKSATWTGERWVIE